MLNPSIRNMNTIRDVDHEINPVPNIERSAGAGGNPFHSVDPMKHVPHNYPVRRSTVIHIKVPKLQGGGEVEEPDDAGGDRPDAMDLREPDDQLSPDDQEQKQVVIEAMAALRGQHPDAEKAIQKFIDLFGEDEFRELRQMVLGQHDEPDEDDMGGPPDDDEDDNQAPPQGVPGSAAPAGMQVGGLMHGPGSGQDDRIEAATPGGNKVMLSDGEYVIDAPTVAMLGDGSTDAGARRLDAFRKEARRQAYGHDGQAKAMKRGGRAALLEALNR